MHEYRIFSSRNANTLKRFECDDPAPTAREVIRMRAVSLNYRNLIIKRGDHPVPRGNPPIAGIDEADDVSAVGGEMRRFRVGYRAAGIYFASCIDGEPIPDKLALVSGAAMDGMLGSASERKSSAARS
jgi:NADPH:quinone reductase-like Zn-dependent oxidoreductase